MIHITEMTGMPISTEDILSQIQGLMAGVDFSSFLETNALYANISSLLGSSCDGLNWVGFYYLKEDGDLILGPFAGKPACTLLKKGRGVCQKAVETNEMVVVDDVHAFDGHIACDSASQSEFVSPVVRDGQVFAVLDIDSPEKDHFTGDVLDLFTQVGNLLSE